jgi:outer membrane protein OmpA-like peptidoglycan-associated protein
MTTSAFTVPGESVSAVFGWAGMFIGALCTAGTVVELGPAASRSPAAHPAVSAPAASNAARSMGEDGRASVDVASSAKANGGERAALATASSTAASTPRRCSLTVQYRAAFEEPGERATAGLEALARHLVVHPELPVRVDGHADAHGDETANLVLSRRRAVAVSLMLERAGVAHARITTRAFGAYQPVDGEDESADAQRRVVVSYPTEAPCPNDVPTTVMP